VTKTRTITKATAVVAAGALVLSACSSNGGDGDASSAGDSTTITLAWDQEYDSYNNTTAGANSSKNAIVNHGVTGGFWYYGEGGAVTANPEFGSYELVSEDPQTVEYSIPPDAVWSDGEAIECADMMLWWAQQTGRYDFSVIGSDGIEDTVMPECELGDKDFTLEYEVPYADWASNGPSNGNQAMMPAHVVAEQGGLTTEELVEAIRDEDTDALADAAEFFNEGWTISGALPDEELIPSSGPYKLAAYDAGQSLTLAPHESWSNFRRSGYPALTPNPLRGDLNTESFFRRLLYPESELNLNPHYRDGTLPDLMDSRTWWDVGRAGQDGVGPNG
jgi:peptide/nickel transport system substrate-binding protein